MEFPAWLPTLLSGLCVALFTAMLARQAKRDDRIERCEQQINGVRLEIAKEYFSAEQAHALISKVDVVIQELHKQNITMARVEAELKAGRQATLAATPHPHQT